MPLAYVYSEVWLKPGVRIVLYYTLFLSWTCSVFVRVFLFGGLFSLFLLFL
jgi:hypothetical protein